MRASAHGGVRPWCEHGSRVTHAVRAAEVVPPAAPGPRPRRAARRRRAWPPRTGCRRRLDHAADPRVGRRRPARDASSRARAMRSVSVRRSCRLRGQRAARDDDASTGRPRPSSLPSGLSPSAPGSHRIGRPTGREEVRGLHRRSGLPPNPARVCSVVRQRQLERVQCVRQWGRPPASSSRAWGTTSSTASRVSTQPLVDPGVLRTSACPTVPATRPRQAAERAHQPHRLGQARAPRARATGAGALGREVAGPEAGAAGGDHQAGEARRRRPAARRPPPRRRRRPTVARSTTVEARPR